MLEDTSQATEELEYLPGATEVSEDAPAEVVDDSQRCNQRSSESLSGDSGSESSRPLSPGPESTHYYYFYQGTIRVFAFSLSSLLIVVLFKVLGDVAALIYS